MACIFSGRDADFLLEHADKVRVIIKTHPFAGVLHGNAVAQQGAGLDDAAVADIRGDAEARRVLENTAKVGFADKEFAAEHIQIQRFGQMAVDEVDDGNDFGKFLRLLDAEARILF
jgi:hypothetical protein